MKTLLSPQWRIFYLTLLIGLVTGTVTSVSAALLLGDPLMARPAFWLWVGLASLLLVGLPHYILFKVALRRL